MKSIRTFFDLRLVGAAVAGILLALAYPGWKLAGLAWLAPGVLLVCASGVSPFRAFQLGYVFGFVQFLISLHWLIYNPFPAGAIAGWIALSGYIAVYPALWVWLCWRMAPRPDVAEAAPQRKVELELGFGFGSAWKPIARATWLRRTRWILLCAALWVALEMVRARMFTGFPWNFLGVSQFEILPLIQIARFAGVHGVSFVVVWGAVALATTSAGLALERARTVKPDGIPVRPSAWRLASFLPASVPGIGLFTDLALPLLAVLGATLDAGVRLVQPADVRGEIKLALVQPSIPQLLIFDPAEATNRFDKIVELSERALAAKPDVLVWPEASLPSFHESHLRALTELIATHGVWMVFGADDAEQYESDENPGEFDYRYFNSAFLFDPAGRYISTYRKKQLVIFGEYIPMERWLPITKHLTPIQGSMTPGPGPVPFRIDSPRATISPLICFEDTFPRLVRHYAGPEIDFLLNLTNDGWFGESSAQWQQAANAAFRAVENGLPLVRCTNNGLTCWIDALGRVREFGVGNERDVHAAGFRLVKIPLSARPRRTTFYQVYGDVFGWGCVAVAGLAVLATGCRFQRRRGENLSQ